MNIKKIAIIGPESTGKSTLSEALAATLHTNWVPEYARDYLEHIDWAYNEDDLLAIAKGQLAAEDNGLATANKALVCDTDLYVVKVWSEHKYGHCDKWILEQIAQRPYDLYLLTYIDVTWTNDVLREHPEPEMRNYFYNTYKDIVQNSGTPWIDVRGSREARMQTSLTAIYNLLNL